MTESRVDEAGRFYRRPQQRPRPDVVADCCPLLSFDPTYQTRWMEDGAAIWYTNRFPSIISIVCQSPPIPTGLLRNDSKFLPRFFRDSSEILPRFFRDSSEILSRCLQDSLRRSIIPSVYEFRSWRSVFVISSLKFIFIMFIISFIILHYIFISYWLLYF